MISTARSSQVRHIERTCFALGMLALLLACVLPLVVHAKQDDRSQPIDVKAAYGEVLAKPDGVSHLKGNVVITQGTLKITGDAATVYFDANSQVRRVVLTGSPVHLQQMDDNDNLIKATSGTVVYDIPTGIATLTGNAHVEQVGRGSASGDTLVYNTTTSTMTGSSQGDHRVHMTFLPRVAPNPATTHPAHAATSGRH